MTTTASTTNRIRKDGNTVKAKSLLGVVFYDKRTGEFVQAMSEPKRYGLEPYNTPAWAIEAKNTAIGRITLWQDSAVPVWAISAHSIATVDDKTVTIYAAMFDDDGGLWWVTMYNGRPAITSAGDTRFYGDAPQVLRRRYRVGGA
jgi:hypothetical protein